MSAPHVVLLSGTLGAGCRTERLARWCADRCQESGATATVLVGADLELPFYRPGETVTPAADRVLRELRAADGVVLLSPSYHGSVTGLLKNALDHVNELAGDERPYLDGRSIGCVALAGGAQGAAATLAGLRSIAHALRGWPTPMGVTLHPGGPDAVPDDVTGGPAGRRQLEAMLEQVLTVRHRPVLQLPDTVQIPSPTPAPVPVLTSAQGAA